VDKVRPFDIPKREVWEAFKKVKANQRPLEWTVSRLQTLRRNCDSRRVKCATRHYEIIL